MANKRSAQSKPLKPRTMALESVIDFNAPRRTMRQAMAELNEFREEWRKRHTRDLR